MPSTKNGEWPHYTADVRGTQVLAARSDQRRQLQQARSRVALQDRQPRPASRVQARRHAARWSRACSTRPAGTRRSVVALDAQDRRADLGAQPARRQARRRSRRGSCRAAASSYWTDGKGDERILYVTTGYRLVALNAKTGAPIPSFGKNGVVDLKVGVVFGKGQQIDLETGEIGLHSTPTVVKDVVIVGSSFREGMTVKTHNNTKGLVRAFDVRTGKLLWTFNTIPRPGEFGNDTWENDSWAINGNTGVWTQITVDEELGLVYLPVETPTSDYYGGHRPGNNLFAESLVCVDLKTGQRKWHFQFVHHPIWDYDMSSAPLLADITVERPADQGGRAAEQAGVPLRVRSRHRPAGLADRRAAGAADRRARREDVADAAVPDQAAGVRAQLR